MSLIPIELRILSQTLQPNTFKSILTRSRFSPCLSSSFPSQTTAFSTTSSKSRSLESPTYPGLFYHSISPTLAKSKKLNPLNSWNLSFLPTPSPTEDFSPTTIGLLAYPPLKEGSEEKRDESIPPPILPRNFEENREFIEVMNEILKEAVLGDLGMETLARVRGDGYIHIADERNPSDPNRVPDPSDIIASILIQKNLLLSDSYSPSGTHRLVTMDGMFKLNDSLMKKLINSLEMVRQVEIEVAEENAVGGGSTE